MRLRFPSGPGWWSMPKPRGGQTMKPPPASELGNPVLIDPLNYDPSNLPSLMWPQAYWTSFAESFTPPVMTANVIGSIREAGWTMYNQPVIDYTPSVAVNAAVGNANMATGDMPGVQMSKVLRSFEEQLTKMQDFLLGVP